jgi:sugar lactone lactonase YvrE
MIQGFPNLGEGFTAVRALIASAGRSIHSLRASRRFVLPFLLLALGVGCSSHHTDASAPGTPPAITEGPLNASTVSGRPVSLSVTATGAATLAYQWAKDGQNLLGAIGSTFTLYQPKVEDAGNYTVTVTNPNGTITSGVATLTVLAAVEFTSPVGLVYDASGNLFVADRDDHTIWKVDATNQKTLVAGSSGLPGAVDGQGSSARFDAPGGLALDPAGNLVVADTGNHTIRRIAPDGTVTTLAGAPGVPGAVDGVGTQARFNAPYGLAVDGTGGTYIADSQNHTIRYLAADGTVSTYAGLAGTPGLVDGTGTSAQFNQPNGIALAPNGTLYVADYGNSCIRAIAQGANVTRLAGQANAHGFADGSALSALFNLPVGITLDAAGVLWITDTRNHAIRRLGADGTVSTPAGSGGNVGNADGTGTAALFRLPCGIVTAPSGNLVVADTGNHLLRTVTPAGVASTFTTP